MAVFPDRIILKNSDDDQAAIEAAIGSGGADEIVYGELVIGRENGSAQLYTVDAIGNIVTVSGGGAQSINELTDVDTSTTPPTDGQALVWVDANSQWEPGDVAASGTAGVAGRGDGGDFDTGTVEASFTFGVYGGGDLDTTTVDEPVEFVGGADGGEIT